MKILITRWSGVLLVEDGGIVDRRAFPHDAESIADRLIRIRRGEILDEERELAKGGVQVTEARLRTLGPVTEFKDWPPAKGNGADAALLREAALLVAREESRAASAQRDRFVAQSVKAMDEILRTVNTLAERLREWYGLYFPEALRRIPDQPTFAKQLAAAPDRESVAKAVPGLLPDQSVGVAFAPEELAALRSYAENLQSLYRERETLESLIERETRQVAPTLAGLVGPLIAARLIAHAGSLEKLASAPASTIQTLGAENALFLHLKEGKKPPKHGVLFQHAWVNTAPWHQRGRISRLLAAQAMVAARMDYFRPEGGDRSAELLADAEKALGIVRAKAKRPGKPRGRGRP